MLAGEPRQRSGATSRFADIGDDRVAERGEGREPRAQRGERRAGPTCSRRARSGSPAASAAMIQRLTRSSSTRDVRARRRRDLRHVGGDQLLLERVGAVEERCARGATASIDAAAARRARPCTRSPQASVSAAALQHAVERARRRRARTVEVPAAAAATTSPSRRARRRRAASSEQALRPWRRRCTSFSVTPPASCVDQVDDAAGRSGPRGPDGGPRGARSTPTRVHERHRLVVVRRTRTSLTIAVAASPVHPGSDGEVRRAARRRRAAARPARQCIAASASVAWSAASRSAHGLNL